MPHLTKQELQLLRQSLQYEESLIQLYRSASQTTDDPVLRGKWEEIAAKHGEHHRQLLSYLN